MKRLLSAAQMRAVDAAAGERGMPAAVLMENAGEALAQAALKLAADTGRFFVFCGPGNNGGDGLVAARKLHAWGRQVFVELVAAASVSKPELARNLEALKSSGVSLRPPQTDARGGDVVIDALLGTGLNRDPSGALAAAIERIGALRSAGAQAVAADVPSGLDSDSGVPLNPCVSADVTVSFGYAKLGQAIEPGATRCGRLEIADIGIPASAERVLEGPPTWLVEADDVRQSIPVRAAASHKGTFGHVLVVGGSPGKTGAPALSAIAALRAGAGLVTVAARAQLLSEVMRHAPELMGVPLAGEGPLSKHDLSALLAATQGKQAVIVGPGLWRGEGTAALLASWLPQLPCPVVIDADGLNALVGHFEILALAKHGVVLTPHPGEMARLLGCPSAEVQVARLQVARRFASEHRVTLILKGARSLVAQADGAVFVNSTGNSGMATGGTGDVLAGLCGALLAQGLTLEKAAVAATWVHGMAGDLAKQQRGEMGLMASDLFDGMTEVWRQWGK